MADIPAFSRQLLQLLAQPSTLDDLLAWAAGQGLKELTVCDAAYNLLGSSGPLQDDNVFVVQRSQKQIMRPESIAEIQAKGIFKKLQTSPEPFWLYNQPLGRWEMFCSILYGGQVLGYIFHCAGQPPAKDDSACWQLLAQAAAVVIQRSGMVEPDAGRQQQESILLQLALGQLTDSAVAQARLEQTGWAALPSYRLGCLFTNQVSLFAVLRPEQLCAQLRSVFPGCICCCYKDRVLLLGPGSLHAQQSTHIRLRHWLQYHHFRIAASSPYTHLMETPAAYAQAQELAYTAGTVAIHTPQPEILYYEDHLPLCACLSAYKKEDILRHIHPHILCFLHHDQKHQTRYLHTLAAYFACGRNMTRASQALFIHKTTLFYRFERMEKLVGPFLQEPKQLFLYEYSLALLRAAGQEGAIG